MINFDTLPQDNPFALPDIGVYRGKIVEAEMKAGKDLAKPPYLNLKIDLYNKDHKKVCSIYDILAESDSNVIMYKISRLVRACGIPLVGAMELKDLAKVILNKDIALDIMHTKPKKGEENGFTPRAQVDIFSRQAYYLPEEFDEEYAGLHESEAPETDFVPDTVGEANAAFDAADGELIEY